MKKLKFILPVLALGLMFSSSALAQENTGTTSNDNSATTTVTRKTCVADAKTARLAAVKAADEALKTANADARAKRDEALKTAKANTDKKAKAAGIKLALKDYKSTLKADSKTRTDAVKAAWTTYSASLKACPKK